MPPLHIPVNPSRVLLVLLVGLHLSAGAGVVFSGLAPAWRTPLLLLVLVSLAVQFRQHLWRRGACAVAEMTRDPNGHWTLQLSDGRLTRAELVRSLVFRFLVILDFKTRYGRCTVLVPADALDRQSHRRLRIALLQRRTD